MQYISKLTPFNKKASPSLKIEASLATHGPILKLSYKILSGLDEVLFSRSEEEHRRVIGLWESTCFECFIKKPNTTNYYEFNFSTEGHWDCFYFKRPGDQLKECELVQRPQINISHNETELSITVEIDTSQLTPDFWNESNMEFGLTSVIEDKQNNISYWAIKHLDTKPNFHNFESFEIVYKAQDLQ